MKFRSLFSRKKMRKKYDWAPREESGKHVYIVSPSLISLRSALNGLLWTHGSRADSED